MMMKKIKLAIPIVALFLFSGNAFAQSNLKFGHINSQELLLLMPERDSAEAKLKAYGTDLSEQIEELHVEYNNKVQNYMQRRATFTDAIREQRESNDMQQRIQDFKPQAQQDFQRMQVKS